MSAASRRPHGLHVRGGRANDRTCRRDLMAFIARSDLAKNVKDTAVRKLTNPKLTWETIALESKPPVATSTAWRRYEKFDTAAREAGFEIDSSENLHWERNACSSSSAVESSGRLRPTSPPRRCAWTDRGGPRPDFLSPCSTQSYTKFHNASSVSCGHT